MKIILSLFALVASCNFGETSLRIVGSDKNGQNVLVKWGGEVYFEGIPGFENKNFVFYVPFEKCTQLYVKIDEKILQEVLCPSENLSEVSILGNEEITLLKWRKGEHYDG